MGNEIIDLSKPIKPIVFDPGRNEWIMKQRDTPPIGVTNRGDSFIPGVTETESMRADGKMYYRRVVHYRSPFRYGDEVEEEGAITASRLPGPTNGGWDLDPHIRWMVTGSPLPIFRTKGNPRLNLELRLRLIIARTVPKVGPQVGQDLLNMLKDPVTITLFVAGIIGFIAVHVSSPTGVGAVIALVMDCITAAIVGYTLGKQAIPFLLALIDFLELVVDAQTEEEVERAATLLAQMISILAVTAITIALTVILKGLFKSMRAKAGNVAKGPIEDPLTQKKPFWMNPKDPIAKSPTALADFKSGGALIKSPGVLATAKQLFRESMRNFFEREELGGYIVEDANGQLSLERWTNKGQLDNILPDNPDIVPGKGLFFKGKKIKGTVHTHPIDAAEIKGFDGTSEYTGPSRGDGLHAQELQKGETANGGKTQFEHYVVAGDQVYVFDHNARFAVVDSFQSLIGK